MLGFKDNFNLKSFLAKFGLYGFMFFLVKGLVWILIAVLSFYFGDDLFKSFSD